MARQLEHVQLLLDELERYGLKGEIADRGKHLEVAWQTFKGRRFVIASRTPSDWRSGLNCRSDMRKMLREDNMQLMPAKELTLNRALSLPTLPVLTQQQRILFLQNDVEALTDLIFDLQAQIRALESKMSSITVVSTVKFGAEATLEREQAVEALPKTRALPRTSSWMPREGSKQHTVYAAMTEQYVHIHTLMKQTGFPLKRVNTILWKLQKEKLVEHGLRGWWRRKP